MYEIGEEGILSHPDWDNKYSCTVKELRENGCILDILGITDPLFRDTQTVSYDVMKMAYRKLSKLEKALR